MMGYDRVGWVVQLKVCLWLSQSMERKVSIMCVSNRNDVDKYNPPYNNYAEQEYHWVLTAMSAINNGLHNL